MDSALLSQKLIALIQKKMGSQQNILSIIEKIFYFPVKNPTGKKIQDSLVITTNNLFFVYNGQIKKISQIKHIDFMTLAILGIQIIIHCQKDDWIRIQSKQIINIIGNILLARQKFLLQKQPFTIHLQIQRTLQNFMEAQSNKKSFFSIFSRKKGDKSLTASGRRVSFCTIQVNQKNFILEIGKKAYKAIFQNAELLHISGDASGFRFDAQNYQYKDLSQTQTLYWKQNEEGNVIKRFLRRKINKMSPYQTELIRKNLSCYKYNEYNEDILFALQLDSHFQILTQLFDNWLYCWEHLIHCNNYERSLMNEAETISKQQVLSQSQLRSIFYKIHTFIQEESRKNNILQSLSLDYVYMCYGDTRISTVFCKLLSRINISYVAPEQFQTLQSRLQNIQQSEYNRRNSFVQLKQISSVKKVEQGKKITTYINKFTPIETYKINLWKLGMFLYQLAYCKLPFPIQYVAFKVKNHDHIKVHFPERDFRSIQFHHFVKSLICKDYHIRGTRLKGDVRMSILNPQISNIMQHEWLVKKKN